MINKRNPTENPAIRKEDNKVNQVKIKERERKEMEEIFFFWIINEELQKRSGALVSDNAFALSFLLYVFFLYNDCIYFFVWVLIKSALFQWFLCVTTRMKKAACNFFDLFMMEWDKSFVLYFNYLHCLRDLNYFSVW